MNPSMMPKPEPKPQVEEDTNEVDPVFVSAEMSQEELDVAQAKRADEDFQRQAGDEAVFSAEAQPEPDDGVIVAREEIELDEAVQKRLKADMAELGKLPDRKAFGQPEHSGAFNALRSAVHTAAEVCDTPAVGLISKAVPQLAVACAAAEGLNELDRANENRLMGRTADAKSAVFEAGRKALSGNDIVQHLETAAVAWDIAKEHIPGVKDLGKDKAPPKPEQTAVAAGAEPAPSGSQAQADAATSAAPEVASSAAPTAAPAMRGPSAGFMSMVMGKDAVSRPNMPTPYDRRPGM